jgi:hypothetical protein
MTQIIEVKSPPALKNPIMLSGVPTAARAKAWGERNKHNTVYFWKRMERVYAEKVVVNSEILEPTKSS